MTLPRSLSLLLALTAAGCSLSVSSVSLSESVESLSKSASSPFESSSASSPGAAKTEYRNDVRDYTAAYVKSGGQYEDFQREVAELARKHGISDWSSNMTTWEGVGEGLARAGVKGIAYETYKSNLAADDPVKMDAIQRGYDRAP